MDVHNVVTIARKEVRDAIRNRWLQLDAVAFAFLALSFSFLSLAGAGSYGFAGFGKAAAGLVNLVLLVVPLMALTIGSGSIAAEADRGTLSYMLAQPVSRSEVLAGKFLGLSTALSAALALGFGAAGVVLAFNGVAAGAEKFAVLVGLSLALALAMLSFGILLSVLAPRASVATGSALFFWLFFAFLSDLGLMGSALVLRLRIPELFGLAILNPLQSFKLAVLSSIHSSLEVLGPVGTYAMQEFGNRLPFLFLGSLVAWFALPFAAAHVAFVRRGNG